MNITKNDTVNNQTNGDTITGVVVVFIALAFAIPILEYCRYYCVHVYGNKVYISDESHDTTVETNTEYE
jgi:hypothetical protein